MMGIAEDAILRFARRVRGDDAAVRRVWNAFPLLEPGDLQLVADRVYERHCEELLSLVAVGRIDADTRLGTRAEVLYAISRMSLASRLQRDVELLGLQIAADFFGMPDLVVKGIEAEFPGSIREVERELRRALRKPERVLRDPLKDPPAHFLAKVA